MELDTIGPPLIGAGSVRLGAPLGSGEFGEVRKGVWSRLPVAVKRLYHERLHNTPQRFLREAALLYAVRHERVVRLYGVVLRPPMLVTELAPLGSLLDCLKTPDLRPLFPPASLPDFAKQICEGMAHLEARRLIHRDLAARNVLVFAPDKVKISDFGLSRALGQGEDYYRTDFHSELRLAVAWCAPECVSELRFTSASDVWAYGVTLWEMFSYGERPWADLSARDIMDAVEPPHLRRLVRPVSCPPRHYSMMLHCWSHCPSDRPTFADLLVELGERVSPSPTSLPSDDSEQAPLIDPDSPSHLTAETSAADENRPPTDARSSTRRRFRWPKKSEVDPVAAELKKKRTVKPISAHDRRTLDSAIALANKITVESMSELDAEVPISPVEKSKFSFFKGNDPGRDVTGAKPEKRNFSREAQCVPDVNALLTEESKFAYESLVEQPCRLETTLMRIKQKQGPHFHSSDMPLKQEGPEEKSEDVIDGDHKPNNALPVPPRDPNKRWEPGKRHVRKHPLVIPELPDPFDSRPRNPFDALSLNFESQVEDSVDCCDGPGGSDARRSAGDDGFLKRSPDRVSVEDLLEFADHKPCGRQRGTDSDEVRIMCKVLNQQVSPEECLLALEFTSWNVHKAIKLAKLRLTSADDKPTLYECSAALNGCEWDLAKATATLTRSSDVTHV